jgi:hypothetical protein
MKILIKLKTQGLFISEINEDGNLFFENGERVDRKNCHEIEIFCDSCDKTILWKSIPQKEYLKKEQFLCRTCRQIGEKNSQFGKKWTDEMKIKRSIEMSGANNPMYGKSFYEVLLNKYGLEEGKK